MMLGSAQRATGLGNLHYKRALYFGGFTARAHATRYPAGLTSAGGQLQLIDLCKLACGHFLHHIQNCLLFGFANLYELHVAKTT
jgi:hypothetical protein